jgi:hypothetical protein
MYKIYSKHENFQKIDVFRFLLVFGFIGARPKILVLWGVPLFYRGVECGHVALPLSLFTAT